MRKEKFYGTYKMHLIGSSENGIHMPTGLTGHYSIYADEKGNEIRLVKQGEKA